MAFGKKTKEKCRIVLRFLFDGQLLTALLIAFSLVTSSYLGANNDLYSLLFPAAIWLVAISVYVVRDRCLRANAGMEEWLLLFMLAVETVLLFVRGFDWVSLYSLIVDYLMLVVVFGGSKDHFYALLAWLCIGVAVFDAISLWTVAAGDYAVRLGCEYGISAEKLALCGVANHTNTLGGINMCAMLAANCLLVHFGRRRKVLTVLTALAWLFFVGMLFCSRSRTGFFSAMISATGLAFFCFFARRRDRHVLLRLAAGTLAVALVIGCMFAGGLLMAHTVTVMIPDQSTQERVGETIDIFHLVNKNGEQSAVPLKDALESKSLSEASEEKATDGLTVDRTVYSRLLEYNALLRLWAKQPVTGIGQGKISERYATALDVGDGAEGIYIHNGYVQVLVVSGGIVFLMVTTAIMMVLCKGIVQCAGVLRTPAEDGNEIAAAMSALLGLMGYNLLENGLLVDFRLTGLLFWLIAGWIARRMSNQDSQKRV